MIGNQTSVANVNQALSVLATQLRSLSQQIAGWQEFIVALGTDGLTACVLHGASGWAVIPRMCT